MQSPNSQESPNQIEKENLSPEDQPSLMQNLMKNNAFTCEEESDSDSNLQDEGNIK